MAAMEAVKVIQATVIHCMKKKRRVSPLLAGGLGGAGLGGNPGFGGAGAGVTAVTELACDIASFTPSQNFPGLQTSEVFRVFGGLTPIRCSGRSSRVNLFPFRSLSVPLAQIG